MKPKVGQSFWSVFVDEGKLDINEWVVTAVRRVCDDKGFGRIPATYQNTVYFTQKTSWTWIKKSKKRLDYGWAKNISHWEKAKLLYDDDWKLNEKRWRNIFSTKLQALKQEEASCKKALRVKFEDQTIEDDELWTAEEQEKEAKSNLTAVRRAITRERNKRK